MRTPHSGALFLPSLHAQETEQDGGRGKAKPDSPAERWLCKSVLETKTRRDNHHSISPFNKGLHPTITLHHLLFNKEQIFSGFSATT